MRFLQFAALAVLLLARSFGAKADSDANPQLCFPKTFMFGSATAAYQVEGAWNEGGRTPSIWDDFCRKKDKVACANVADDFYHRYKSDIQMIKDAGHTSFRFSISWSRAMNWDPSTKHMKPNPTGIAFYHSLIDELRRNDITPILTIYHWDLPIELETQLSAPGWLTSDIHEHYVEFAELMFREFGTKVDNWATFNEPFIFISYGYGASIVGGPSMAPGFGGSDTMQYTVAHNVLLSHAKAVHKFRELKAQHAVGPNARIGIVIPGEHTLPMDPSKPEDVEAANRVHQFWMGWFMDPIIKGDYPEVMKKRVGDRLPKFTAEESALLKGTYDLFMLNHYSSHEATPCDSPRSTKPCSKMTVGWERDLGVDNNKKPAGSLSSGVDENGVEVCGHFAAYPKGYRELIKWMHAHNTSTDILLTENGYCGGNDPVGEDRLWYHQTYLEQVHKAITEDKIPVIGYTAWSLLDNYEWGSFKPRFGLYYVNYTSQVGSKESWTPKSTDLVRTPKLAATWFSEVAKTGCMEPWKGETPVVKGASTSKSASSVWIWVVVLVVVVIVAAGIAIRCRRLGNASERAPLL